MLHLVFVGCNVIVVDGMEMYIENTNFKSFKNCLNLGIFTTLKVLVIGDVQEQILMNILKM